MKLTPEQIRDEAHSISLKATDGKCGEIRNEILALLEKATGEKIPEPFERNVKHLSLWNRDGDIELLFHIGTASTVAEKYFVINSNFQPYLMDVLGVINQAEAVKRYRSAEYLGQYNFHSGIPNS